MQSVGLLLRWVGDVAFDRAVSDNSFNTEVADHDLVAVATDPTGLNLRGVTPVSPCLWKTSVTARRASGI